MFLGGCGLDQDTEGLSNEQKADWELSPGYQKIKKNIKFCLIQSK